MLTISPRALEHFRRLLDRQGGTDTGIRLHVLDAGTPAARCELEFCEPGELSGREHRLDLDTLDFYLDADAAPWLEDATIDFEPDATGGQLNIRAPRIKGGVPGPEAALADRVRYVLEAEINPRLAAHGGRVSLVGVDAAGVVTLRFGGGCHGCGMVDVTLRQGVEKTLRERVPEITAVEDGTDHGSAEQPYYRGQQGRSAIG
ncbi:NfuA family Fe-S biogenesis protein [Aerosticca soli]|jgi:Fe/S biogenesis protein NfuA|uniref:Fe/S biogenesis protein NfuA n=1 Tax=Aerosticca soli TaxID=2010829 RepID=A0A2Z6E5I9_9GAMM|nr:NfuA family Fe-S biogenesis protein [Aerosticca soli]MDI3261558.1 NfuA family Fe-S biogenesis protein [Fulvimonas sp.]BBD79984.1 NfuA Fe-S protein maturation [Aerosticca soli]